MSPFDATVHEMAMALHALSDSLNSVKKTLRRNKWVLRTLIVSFIMDIVLTVSLSAVTVNQAAISHRIHESQIRACEIGNKTRKGQVLLWDHVVLSALAPYARETPAQKTRRLRIAASIRFYVHTTFRQINCLRLYGKR